MIYRLTDASPLLFLAKLKHLELLTLGVDGVLVPSAVMAEVRAKPDPAAEGNPRAGRYFRSCLRGGGRWSR